jgi:hypothetical protein
MTQRPDHDSKNKTVRTGQLGQQEKDSHGRPAEGLIRRDRSLATSQAGQPGLVSLDRSGRTGQPEQATQNKPKTNFKKYR